MLTTIIQKTTITALILFFLHTIYPLVTADPQKTTKQHIEDRYPIKIIKQYDVFKKKRARTFPRKKPIKYFIVHGTAGGSTISWIKRMPYWKRRARSYRRGVSSFHYLILRNGTIYGLIPPERYVFHSHGGRRMDTESIGVELENYNYRNRGRYTEAQYESLVNLYTYLRVIQNYNEMGSITGHGRVKRLMTGGWKVCPGPGFSWKYLTKKLKKYGYTHKKRKRLYDYFIDIKSSVHYRYIHLLK